MCLSGHFISRRSQVSELDSQGLLKVQWIQWGERLVRCASVLLRGQAVQERCLLSFNQQQATLSL